MAEADTTSDTTPIPQRFWWLRRIAVVMVLFGCVLVGLRYASLAMAKRRLEAEISALKARGEPLEREDFLDRPASPGEDAGPDLLAAGKMFVVPSQYQTAWNQIWLAPAGIKNTAMIDAVLSANR